MNETTILVWANIAIIGVIAIIIVKLYFRKDELEKDETPLIQKDSVNGLIQTGKDKLKNSQNTLSKTTSPNSSVSTYFSKNQPKNTSLRKKGQIPQDNFNSYVVPETNKETFSNKKETNKKPINFNYETKVQKFQEPINETQMDIMSKNKENTKKENIENNISINKKPKHELKDLFSIDELIKESKRKDSEREKESKTIRREKEDTTEIKESIKQRKLGKIEDEPLTEIKTETKTTTKDKQDLLVENKKEENTTDETNPYDVVNESNTYKKTNESKKIKNSIYNSEGITNAVKSSEKEDSNPKDKTITEILAKGESKDNSTETKKENTTDEANPYDVINESNTYKKTNESKKIKNSIYNSEGITNAVKSSEKEDSNPKDKTITEILAKGESKDNSTETKKENTNNDVITEKETKENTIKDIVSEDKDNSQDEENVADVLAKDNVKTPSLKTPTKTETKENELSVLPTNEEDYKFGAQLEESELFNNEEENELSDLDYRKDLAKITNTIKNSKIFNEVKEKLAPEHEINEEEQLADEMYLRNINTYNEPEFPEYEPIINERHENYVNDYDYEEPTQEQLIREENTRKVFNMVKKSETTEPQNADDIKIKETSSGSSIKIKEKPARNNIKITLNNEEITLHKGAEIIFKHDNESYSSKVYGIRGDEISVKYRGKIIIITPKDIKKIY